jgi:hypothetical protein
MNHISADYHKRAAAFVRANHDMTAVVHAKPEASEVQRENAIKVAWFTYFQARGMESTLQTCRFILNGGGKAVTFPCERPDLFDPSYEVPRHSWRDPDGAVRSQERGDVSAVVKSTLASLRAANVRGAKPAPPRPQYATQSPQEWLDGYQDNPPPIPVFSDDFKRKLGLAT